MLAGNEKSRVDTRHTAMLQGRMRDASGTRPVRVYDLSSKGMLVVSERPPERGAIVDILINGHHVAGQVRWVSGRRFGLRTREHVDVAALVSGRRASKHIAGKKIEPVNDPDAWSPQKLLIAYGVLGVTALATAYLLVTWLIL
ncbi:PilZ domain-containing protein [Aurantiacibacter luteus]|uniref:PilZ domain-containing protein n=1 Tax=Aurantiacibacter luteus TaxID=1581420 RepID=UPI00069BF47D|nr:PilZ domain-containing protein [Aurantiacibacter luteus]